MFLREMITKEEMLPMLVEACPSFANKWQEHKQEYDGEEDFLPYVALGEFARHLIALKNLNQTDEFEKVFMTVERLHLQGNEYVREAATIGFLEGLQNNADESAEEFVQYLKPVSLKWWNELNRFWSGENQYVGQTLNGKS